ncbi:hypothetical protein C0J52_08550, partial [Blattella germanica]
YLYKNSSYKHLSTSPYEHELVNRDFDLPFVIIRLINYVCLISFNHLLFHHLNYKNIMSVKFEPGVVNGVLKLSSYNILNKNGPHSRPSTP